MSNVKLKAGDVVGCIWEEGPHDVKTVAASYLSLRTLDGRSITFSNNGKRYKHDTYPSVWLWEEGSPPKMGKRKFEYPITKLWKLIGSIVKFNVIKSGEDLYIGEENSHDVGDHIDHRWEDCERPVWKPKVPTWCKCWSLDAKNTSLDVITHYVEGHTWPYKGMVNTYMHAEPLPYDEIPEFSRWPREWWEAAQS